MEFGFFNDSISPVAGIKVHAMDLGIQRGYGVFDFFRLVDGHNEYLQLYLDRFYNSLELAGLRFRYSRTELINIVNTVIEKNNSPNSCIKMVVTGGVSADGYSLPTESNFFIFNLPYRPPSKVNYENGVKLITQQYQRPCPAVKSTNYFFSLLLTKKMAEFGAIDVLYFHPSSIFETSRCNIFIVKNEEVFTPKEGMLEGITRHKILKMDSKPFPLTAKRISKTELDEADEVFISSTTKEILPVIQLDHHKVSDGKVGPVTSAYMQVLSNA